ncbi:MAG: Ig-like domain-containing protein [Vulcanimicrobiota bacterium]
MTVEKGEVVEWSDVSVTVTRFVVEYLNGDNEVVGLSQARVALLEGEVFILDNLEVLGVSETLPVDLLSLTISPSAPGILVGESQDFTAEALYSDGSTKDLTSQVSWDSENKATATMAGATASGLVEGQSRITATFGGKSAETILSVLEPEIV